MAIETTPNPRFRLQSISSTLRLQSIRSPGTGETDSVAAPNARMFVGSMSPRYEWLLSASSLASDSLSLVRSLATDFPGAPPRRTVHAADFGAEDVDWS